MREIVHIQAGQCGNQIGAKVMNYDHSNITHNKFVKKKEKCAKKNYKIIIQLFQVNFGNCVKKYKAFPFWAFVPKHN